MSVPPPPNQWGSQPPSGGQPGVPSWGGQPPSGPQGGGPQWGPGPGGQPGGVPPWGPQQQWAGPPGQPPSGGGRWKWILGGLVILLVVALAVVITILVVKPSGDGSSKSSGSNSDIASADDKGPVGIITDDPTCDSWSRISRDYSEVSDSVNWGNRDQNIPASAWTPEQRSMYQSVGKALRTATNSARNLIPKTPHRVMRELYEQFVVYGTSFYDRISLYTAKDRYLAGATDGLASGLAAICSALDYHSAQTFGPQVPPVAPPSVFVDVSRAGGSPKFMAESDAICSDWTKEVEKFDSDTVDWRKTDPQIPASQWTPDERSINDAVMPVMKTHADSLERISRRSDNGVTQDFGVLAAQYQRAIAMALPTYTDADFYLSQAASFVAASINAACKASEG